MNCLSEARKGAHLRCRYRDGVVFNIVPVRARTRNVNCDGDASFDGSLLRPFVLSEAEFKRTMRAFEASFTKCLDTLLTLMAGEAGGEKSTAEDLQRFQARLYDALLKLSREYHRLRIRRKSLISGKSSLSAAWFKRRQRTLVERQKALQRAIRAGRNRAMRSSGSSIGTTPNS